MNRMDFEAIKHDAARKVFGSNWADMLDNTEQYDRLTKGMDESELKEFWWQIFTDMLKADEA